VRVMYMVSSMLFFSLFLNPWLLPSDFLFRFVTIILWFVFVHAIYFTYLVLSIRKSSVNAPSRSKTLLHPQTNNGTIDSEMSILSNLFAGVPSPTDLLNQWKKSQTQIPQLSPHDV
jgi:hypothetical protein